MQKTADMIAAQRRIFVCRIARSFGNDELLVTHLPGWLRHLTGAC
jgi:hypothetical protein